MLYALLNSKHEKNARVC